MTERDPQPDGAAAAPTVEPSVDPLLPKSTSRRRRKRRKQQLRPTAWRSVIASDGLFILVLVGSVLPLGAVHNPVFLGVAVVTMLAALRMLLGAPRPAIATVGLAAVLGCLALYTALQAVPIPLGWLDGLSPTAAAVWRHVVEPPGLPIPRLASLSLDPGATWIEALKWWSYAAVFIMAGAFGMRYGEKWGAILILSLALLVALSTIGHGVFRATRVFGIYAPSMGGRGWRIGPLVNSNVLAGYLNLGLLAGFGVVASNTVPLPRWLLALAVATVLGVSVNTGSRGGLASLLVGLLILLPLLHRARAVEGSQSKRDRLYTIAALGLALAVGAVFAIVAATHMTVHLLSDPSVRKLRMMLWAPAMIGDYPWFGVGRGAFEGAFPAYRMGDNNSVYTHPENFLVQWATEWGVPVTCALLASLGWLLRPAAWGAGRSAAGSGLFAGFAALAMQNVVDLGLEIPGVAIAACGAAGVALGGRAALLDRSTARVRPEMVSIALAVVGIALFVPAALLGLDSLRSDKQLVSESFPEDLRSSEDVARFKDLLVVAMLRHPAEPYFPRDGALMAMLSHSENPVPWVQRALERAPGSGRTHYLLAALMARRKVRSQSLLELRFAAQQDQDLSTRVARFATRLTRDHDELMNVVPAGRDGAIELSALGELFKRQRDQDLSYRFFQEALERNPGALGARIALARMLLNDLADRRLGARCAEERRIDCQKAILQHIRALAQALPHSDEPLELAVRLLLSAGRPVQATNLVSALCPTLPDRSRCMRVWVEAAAQSGDSEAFAQAVRFSERDGCVTPKACAGTYTSIGDVLSHTSGPFAALPYYRRAVSEDPSKANWMRVAAVAAIIGEHGEASRALNHAAAYGEASPELRDSLERERDKAMKETLKIH